MNIKGVFIALFISAISFGQNPTAIENHELTKDFVLGKFNYTNHDLFIKTHPSHSSKTTYLNKDVYTAFINMFNHAKTDSISLKIISGTRNFNEQKAIWERKWKKYNILKPIERAKKILEYSAMPSTSRHHWGTDIDLNSFSNFYFEKGQGKREYDWLLKNANKYGFYQVYTDRTTGRTGYNLERWHWSYMPLASKFLSFYNTHVVDSDIKDFTGSELSNILKIIPEYVNGISNEVQISTKN
ncbi:M15 family metallopeptidase [uncultured Algibacter sp.]|uniref:M15 family metallopeptidase n=1 Tax=uncultured Algibacter sp. TaxID=298659 RepID=UPI00262C5B65|nr:M15 family metallopeptidase [uncultured Algibacter sp.]